MSTLSFPSPRAPRTIGAHADHKTSDFFFPRVQSLEMRAIPWGKRAKPVRSWIEIGSWYAVACCSVLVALYLI